MAFDLKAVFSLDGRPFERTLKQQEQNASKSAQKMGSHLESAFSGVGGDLKGKFAGLFTLGAIEAAIHSVVDYVTHLKDFSEQNRISTDEAQRLSIALKSLGLEEEVGAAALNKITAARRDAINGNDEMRDSLKRAGIEFDTLQDGSKRSIDLLFEMAAAARAGGADLDAMADIVGDKLATKIASLIEALDKVGKKKIVSAEDVEKIDDATKKVEEFGRQAKVLGAGFLAKAIDDPTGVPVVGPLLSLFLQGKKGAEKLNKLPAIIHRDRPPEKMPDSFDAEYLAEIAKENPEKLKASKKVLDDLRRQIHAKDLQLMSPEERKTALREDLQKAMGDVAGAPDELGRLKALDRQRDLEIALHGLDQKSDSRGRSQGLVADSLAAIGGASINAANSPVRHLENIAKYTMETARNTKPGKGYGILTERDEHGQVLGRWVEGELP